MLCYYIAATGRRKKVEKASRQWNEPMIAQFTPHSSERQERSILETVGDNLEITAIYTITFTPRHFREKPVSSFLCRLT